MVHEPTQVLYSAKCLPVYPDGVGTPTMTLTDPVD